MRSSACCTTRSSIGYRFLLCCVALLCSGATNAQEGNAPGPTATQASPFPALSKAVEANTLRAEGKPPFHLKLSFQIFDLKGKPEETGTLDEWWAGPDGSYVEITAPSLGTLHSLNANSLPNDKASRSLLLIRELLEAVRAPYRSLPEKGKLVSEKKSEGNVSMSCMHVEPDTPVTKFFDPRVVCVDEATNTIRTVSDRYLAISRNTLGTFAGTRVSSDVQISLLGRPAITGHVEALSGFKASKSPVPLELPPVKALDSAGGMNPLGPAVSWTGGRLVRQARRSVPTSFHDYIYSGSVILNVHITERGDVEHTVPLASADPRLTDAAMDICRQWLFEPYLKNGQAVPRDRVLTMRFQSLQLDYWSFSNAL